MKTSDFFYDLPEELIAQHPIPRRDQSRLLSLDGLTGEISHTIFSALPSLLHPGDCLVLNNTRVIPARLLGVVSDSGTAAEILLLHRREENIWETIVRPGRKLRTGCRVDLIPGRFFGEVISVLDSGNRLVRFSFEGIWEEMLEEVGTMPLPPYIREKLSDPERYQTVYASESGSAAAPTAGLHFTEELLSEIRGEGVFTAELTLHVGLGTFRPVKTENIGEHHMHAEWYEFPERAAETIRSCKKNGGRIVAVGTTSCRTLEMAARNDGHLSPSCGWTDIFIYPGYTFRAVDALITNFHLPESTLLMLVSAFAGKENILRAYRTAVCERYRFFSFGDAMFMTKRE